VPEEDEYLAIARQLGMFLRRAERLHAGVRSGADGFGLERSTFMLLGRVAGDGPVRLSTLAADLCVDLSVVSRQVAALESAGLVSRTGDPSDRRASLIAVTTTGEEVFTRKRDRFLSVLRGILSDWTSTERQEFARLFGRFNEAIATTAVATEQET
jgi:DNA-binding MarR family transcriptional regulator